MGVEAHAKGSGKVSPMISLMSRQGAGGVLAQLRSSTALRQLSQGSIGIVDVDTWAYATAQPTRWSSVWALWAKK